MTLYCRKDHYEALYASYLRSDPNILLDAAGIEPGDWSRLLVLDLCGGNGRLSLAARQMGAKVTMVDVDHEMCDGFLLRQQGIDVWFGKVEQIIPVWDSSFNAAFCQQAINYWLTPETAESTARLLKRDGVFVFNTFNTLPSTVPTIRERQVDGHMEYEVFHSAGGMVHHVQLREGYAPHQTSFRWIPPDEFDRMLEPHFDVERRTDGRTDIYVCRKRGR